MNHTSLEEMMREMGIDPDALPGAYKGSKPLTPSQEAGKRALDEVARLKKKWERKP